MAELWEAALGVQAHQDLLHSLVQRSPGVPSLEGYLHYLGLLGLVVSHLGAGWWVPLGPRGSPLCLGHCHQGLWEVPRPHPRSHPAHLAHPAPQ